MSKIQKSKYKYSQVRKINKKQRLDAYMRGFLCSCNNREKECIREAYNLLNKYADVLISPQSNEQVIEECDSKDIEIEEELKAELSNLKSIQKDLKRFQVVESGAKNFLFISTTIENPVLLAEKIVSDIESTKIQQTRFLIRLIPIEITCKAYVKDIENTFKPMAEKYFKDKATTFSVIYNHRNNTTLNKEEVIKLVAEMVLQVRPDHKVDLKNAEVSIIIEIIKGIALISVISNFIKHKKYNLLALSEQSLVESSAESRPQEEKQHE